MIGGGNGAYATAADLGREGREVTMFARTESQLAPVKRKDGIVLIDEKDSRTEVKGIKVEKSARKALENADLVIVAVPSTGHATIAKMIARYLTSDQVVLLNPGHTGGALEFRQSIVEAGWRAKTQLCETMTLTYLTRLVGPGIVRIFKKSKNIMYAALPASDLTSDVASDLEEMFPGLVKVKNVLVTGLSNVNAMMHPPGMIMNAGWIEHTQGGFRFYVEGITPSIARVIDCLDRERMAIMKSLGMKPVSFGNVFHSIGSSTIGKGSVYEIIQHSEPNREIRAPKSLDNRYIHEDVGYGLVPMLEFAKIGGIETPVMNYLTELASLINGRKYVEEGRYRFKARNQRNGQIRTSEFCQ